MGSSLGYDNGAMTTGWTIGGNDLLAISWLSLLSMIGYEWHDLQAMKTGY